MAVRAHAYARQGGMNRRQAGEDFYFMQKLVDGEQVENIAEATVLSVREIVSSGAIRYRQGAQRCGRESVGCWLLFAKDLCRSQGFFDQLPVCFQSGPKLFLDRLSEPLQDFVQSEC